MPPQPTSLYAFQLIEFKSDHVTVQNQDTLEILDISYELANAFKSNGLFI